MIDSHGGKLNDKYLPLESYIKVFNNILRKKIIISKLPEENMFALHWRSFR